MKEIFQEYGGILITVVAILAVILVITAVVGTDTSGPIGSAFQTLVKNFIDQANKNTGLPTPLWGCMELGKEYFGPLWKYIANEEITDVDYNGREIWLTNIYNERYRVNQAYVDENMTLAFVEQFTQRIANVVSQQFNKQNPELEAETSELRVTVLHESIARSGRSISIRKTPPVIRLTAEKALQEQYCSRDILAVLVNCVLTKMNLIFCGMPGIGKTECVKFFSQYVPGNERVITIEDTMEIRYSVTNPGKDCIEMRVNDRFDYADAIKASLRLNPKWIMLSEARSKEVKYLLEGWSTGVRGMTTLHTDDVRNIPDRILNMLETRVDADRLENDIYQAMDVGVLIRKKKNGAGQVYRYIDQVCFFDREGQKNKIIMAVTDGKLVLKEFPESLLRRFKREGVDNPLLCSLLDQQLGKDADREVET